MKSKFTATKNFVARHKVALAVTGTATICYALHYMSLQQYNDFLKEQGLYDKFNTPEV